MSLARTQAQNPSSSPITHRPSQNFPKRMTNAMKRISVPPAIRVLGGMMFLVNTSYIIILSLAPIFLNTVIGVSTIWIGLLEGVVESVSFLIKLCSGIVSDYFRKRKWLMVIGYALTVFSKPIIAISNKYFLVFIARLCERLGNGLQATPRDAMVGDIAQPGNRGACFGLMRSMGTAGSCLGGILGFLAMIYTDGNFQQVFLVATLPAFCAFCILVFFVKEPKHHVPENAPEKRPIKLSDVKLLGRPYWLLMIVVAVFMLARVSETMMVLLAQKNFGLDKVYAPLIMSTYNVTYSLSSFPSGWLSDKIGRRGVMAFGIAALAVADFFLATATNLYGVFIGVLIWGVQMGISQSVFVALITDYVPEDLRGTGIGFFHLISAVSALIAGLGGGTIAHFYGLSSTFAYSLCVAIIALVVLLFFIPNAKKR